MSRSVPHFSGVIRRVVFQADSGRALVRRVPLTCGLLVLMWVLALGTTGVGGPRGRLAEAILAGVSGVGAHPFAVVLSLLWAPGPVAYVWATAALLTLGVFAEWRLGPARYATALLVSHVAGVLGGFVVAWAAGFVFTGWATQLSGARFGGPALGVVGAAMAATASMDTMWRRRWRLPGVVLPATLVLFNGAMVSIMLLCASLAGYLAGRLLTVRKRRITAAVASIGESRILVAILCAVAAAGPPLAAVSAGANGPFSILGEILTSVQDTSPESVHEVCAGAATAAECALAQLQLRAGPGALIMACLTSLLLLVLAYGLRLGRRFAWWGSLALQGGLTLAAVRFFLNFRSEPGQETNALLGPGTGPVQFIADLIVPALVPLAIIVLLVFTRGLFTVRAPSGCYRRLAAKVCAAAAAAAVLYVGGGMAVASQFSPVADPVRLLSNFPQRLAPVAATLRTTPDLLPNGPGADILFEWIGVIFWAYTAREIIRSFRRPDTAFLHEGRDRARALLEHYGGGSLGWMGMWEGTSYWFNSTGTTYLPYRVLAGVALTTGAPVGPETERAEALREFAGRCARMSWSPCLYSVGEEIRGMTDQLGWRSVQVAQDTVLDLGGVSFAGKQFQNVRTALNKARRDGLDVEWFHFPTAPRNIAAQIRSISEEWVADHALPELGFTLGGLNELNDPAVKCSMIIDQNRTVHAVASWLPVHDDGKVIGWTLDFMRRRGTTGGRNSIEVLIARAALDFQAQGYRFLSLSGTPLATPVAERSPDTFQGPLEQFLDFLSRTIEPVYGFKSLAAFKAKFNPRYEPLYMVYPDPTSLPAIGQAISKAYLPEGSILHLWTLLRHARTRQESGSRIPDPPEDKPQVPNPSEHLHSGQGLARPQRNGR